MKICMPVAEDKGMKSVLHGHFGSAPCFALYDSETQRTVFTSNNEAEHEHGKCMPVNTLRTLGAEAVLCRGMGLRAAHLLAAAGIRPYLVEAETVGDAVEKYDKRDICVLDERTSCHAHDCH
ncbi:MAG TPA: NifB/NifX family molybdenum-iron cluster-binding protein [Chitinivibrionales bacterium]|nr:NifB/NifX family molybdenum-iron cluster-binding protein [Chitinivibrionales bacterium]